MRMIFAFKECGSQSKKRIFSFKEIIRWIGARQTRVDIFITHMAPSSKINVRRFLIYYIFYVIIKA